MTNDAAAAAYHQLPGDCSTSANSLLLPSWNGNTGESSATQPSLAAGQTSHSPIAFPAMSQESTGSIVLTADPTPLPTVVSAGAPLLLTTPYHTEDSPALIHKQGSAPQAHRAMPPYQVLLPPPQGMPEHQRTTPGLTSASTDIVAVLHWLPTREELDGMVSRIQSSLQRDIVDLQTTTSLSSRIQQSTDHSELQQKVSILENRHASSMDATLKLQLHMMI